jgi:hypothetical protein
MAAGKELDRASLRSFIGSDDQQLVMWQVLPAVPAARDLNLDDLATIDGLIADTRIRSRTPDPRSQRLLALLQDGRQSLVFVTAVETVRYLREQLKSLRIAWCTGERAGIGFTTMPREAVLSWFRPGPVKEGGPRVLVTTDVAAEGLDLQAAGRVIHYDLPWTAVRMDQRDGRALRIGSRHEEVEVIRFDLPTEIEARLGQLAVLARKRRLPRRAGLDMRGSRCWTWRDLIAARLGMTVSTPEGRVCAVRAPFTGALAGFSLYGIGPAEQPRRLAAVLGCLGPDGTWSEEPSRVEQWIEAAVGCADSLLKEETMNDLLQLLTRVVRTRLEAARATKWSPPLPTPVHTALIARLNRKASQATRARDATRLLQIDQALSFVRRGHTAGEEMWLESLLDLPDRPFLAELCRSPTLEAEASIFFARLTGLILFSPS